MAGAVRVTYGENATDGVMVCIEDDEPITFPKLEVPVPAAREGELEGGMPSPGPQQA
jgi:hypothetical protein